MKRRRVLQAGGVVIGSSLSGCGVLSSAEDKYVFARVVEEEPPNEEVMDFSNEQVQANEYARELVPEAVNGGGYVERRVPNGEANPIGDLPTGYIAYEDDVVRMLIRTLE
jgi:hypothetical protein